MTINKVFTISLLAFSLVFSGFASAALPDPGMQIEPGRTALVITDPQNDFLALLI